MDISRWTIDERMRLPDFCFGNRRVIGAYKANLSAGTPAWEISDTSFPDPCCIWQVAIFTQLTVNGSGRLRMGFADVVPTSTGEMDAAGEIFPDFGKKQAGPNMIPIRGSTYTLWAMDTRQGLATHGKKLVIEVYLSSGELRVDVTMVVSKLPTSISGYLANKFMTEVR